MKQVCVHNIVTYIVDRNGLLQLFTLRKLLVLPPTHFGQKKGGKLMNNVSSNVMGLKAIKEQTTKLCLIFNLSIEPYIRAM